MQVKDILEKLNSKNKINVITTNLLRHTRTLVTLVM